MIKKWFEFIKESNSSGIIYAISEKNINDSLIDLIDLNYEVSYERGLYVDGYFMNIMLSGEQRPAYKISIGCGHKQDVNIDDVISSFIDYYKSNNDISLNIQDVGGYNTMMNVDIVDDIQIYQKSIEGFDYCYFEITIGEKKTYNISNSDLMKYYSWESSLPDGIYVKVEDLIYKIVDSDNKRYLLNGIDYEDYRGYGYRPSIDTLMSYVDNDRFIKKVIDELGEEFIKDELDISEGSVFEFLSDNEKMMSKLDSEFISDVRDLFEELTISKLSVEDYKLLLNEFHRQLDRLDITYRFVNEEYHIEIDNSLIISYFENSDDDFNRFKIEDVIDSYLDNISLDIKVDFHDYVDISKEFSIEIEDLYKSKY